MANRWTISTLAGTGEPGFAGDGGPALAAQLNNPFDLAFDPEGNLVFSDTFNHCLRRIDARSGGIATIAGTGERGFAGDGGPAIRARFNEPYGVTIDRAGTIYVADRLNRRVRCIDGATGTITTVAGEGSPFGEPLVEPNGLALDPTHRFLYVADVAGAGGDGGPATAAGLARPHGAVVGPDGAIYLGDSENHRIRKLAPAG